MLERGAEIYATESLGVKLNRLAPFGCARNVEFQAENVVKARGFIDASSASS